MDKLNPINVCSFIRRKKRGRTCDLLDARESACWYMVFELSHHRRILEEAPIHVSHRAVRTSERRAHVGFRFGTSASSCALREPATWRFRLRNNRSWRGRLLGVEPAESPTLLLGRLGKHAERVLTLVIAVRNQNGDTDRDPTPMELEKMKALVAEAMQQGAVGLSRALIYPPGSYAKTQGLVAGFIYSS